MAAPRNDPFQTDIQTMSLRELYHASRRLVSLEKKHRASIDSWERCLQKTHDMVQMYAEQVLRAVGSRRQVLLTRIEKWRSRIPYEKAAIEVVQNLLSRVHELMRNVEARRIELRLAPKPRKPRVPTLEESEEEPVCLEPETLFVRLLSGEIQPVVVDMMGPINSLGREFARQNRYHPSSVKRMAFFLPSEEKDEDEKTTEEEPTVKVSLVTSQLGVMVLLDVIPPVPVEEPAPVPFYSADHPRTGMIFRNLFPRGSELPVLHLFIRGPNPNKIGEKLKLLRRILVDEMRYNMYDDDELFPMYDSWYIHQRGPHVNNRYKAMKEFVSAYSEKFWPMNEEEEKESEAWNCEWKDIQEFREFVAKEARLLSINVCYSDRFCEGRVLSRHMVMRRLGEGEWGLQEIRASVSLLRHYLTVEELVRLGVPSPLLCSCNEPACFVRDFPSWMARAGSFYIPPIVEVDHTLAQEDPAVLLQMMTR